MEGNFGGVLNNWSILFGKMRTHYFLFPSFPALILISGKGFLIIDRKSYPISGLRIKQESGGRVKKREWE
jgi:hypothetical protein